MIEIIFRNGEIKQYKPDEYTEYRLCGRLFVVIYEKQWIGIYNLDDIVSVEIGTVEDAEKGNSDYTYIGHLKENKELEEVTAIANRIGIHKLYAMVKEIRGE